jgi:hypothetical protein
MKAGIYTIMSQIYIIPYVKFTYDKWLNGYYELSIGWLNKEITVSW